MIRLLRCEPVRLTGLLTLAVAWKLAFLSAGWVPFNADEAVVALMARHILQGERPVFFYGQVYMGSLDAWLVAAGFALFGQQVWVIRLVQILLYLGVVLGVYLLAHRLLASPRLALIAGLLVALPAVNTTLYTTASLGGYGEALLLGALMLLVVFQTCLSASAALLWGLLAGLGWWANGLSLVFSIPTGIYLAWTLFRAPISSTGRLAALAAAAAGFLVGSAPWWGYALATGPERLLAELLGGAVAVETGSRIAQAGTHLVNMFLLGLPALLGFRPPWEVRWLALPLLPFLLFFWCAVTIDGLRRLPRARAEFWALVGVVGMVTAGFLFTPFGVDPSGRYFLPMLIPFALAGARWIGRFARHPRRQAALALLVVLYHAAGTLQAVSTSPTGLTTQFFAPSIIDHRYDDDLIDFLQETGETRGYSTYWISYPLAFRSGEELLFVPALPYHPDLRYTPRDNRYPPYQDAVDASPRVAYIGSTRNPALSTDLRSSFSLLGITWSERTIGDYQVFYRLSRPVRPQAIGFGVTRKAWQ